MYIVQEIIKEKNFKKRIPMWKTKPGTKIEKSRQKKLGHHSEPTAAVHLAATVTHLLECAIS